MTWVVGSVPVAGASEPLGGIRLIAVGSSGSLATSIDAITWTPRTSGFGTTDISAGAYSPALDRAVIVGESGTLATSSDGINWTTQTSSFSTTDIIDVEWSPALDLFLAVGNSGKIATSPNGITWTQRTSGFGGSHVFCAAWSEDLGLFVIGGLAGKISTSPDGITFTSRTNPFGLLAVNGVTWNSNIGLFHAEAQAAGTAEQGTSPDGITWTERSTPTSGNGDASGFAGTGSDLLAGGGGPDLDISTDGITYTPVTVFGSGHSTGGMTYSAALGLYLVCGGSLSQYRISSSPDGTTWTTRTSGSTGPLDNVPRDIIVVA